MDATPPKRSQLLKALEDIGKESQSALLMQYTTFHIGIYISLAVGVLAAPKFAELAHGELMLFPLLCFLIAGLAGGVIARNLIEYETFDQFKDKHIGFWIFKPCTFSIWSYVEHNSFWIGLLSGFGIVYWDWYLGSAPS